MIPSFSARTNERKFPQNGYCKCSDYTPTHISIRKRKKRKSGFWSNQASIFYVELNLFAGKFVHIVLQIRTKSNTFLIRFSFLFGDTEGKNGDIERKKWQFVVITYPKQQQPSAVQEGTWLSPDIADATPTTPAIKENVTKNPMATFPIGKYIGKKCARRSNLGPRVHTKSIISKCKLQTY